MRWLVDSVNGIRRRLQQMKIDVKVWIKTLKLVSFLMILFLLSLSLSFHGEADRVLIVITR